MVTVGAVPKDAAAPTFVRESGIAAAYKYCSIEFVKWLAEEHCCDPHTCAPVCS